MALAARSSRMALAQQSCSTKVPAACRVSSSSSRRRSVRVCANQGIDRETGFVAEDNSGRANIFPTKQQAYLKSSTSDDAARQGLGGAQGGLLVGFVIAAVVAATYLGAKTGPETLEQVTETFSGDALSAIAGRISASL